MAKTEVDPSGRCNEPSEAAPPCADILTEIGTQPIFPHLAERLRTEVTRGEYSELAAFTLSMASAWAYSVPWCMGEAMKFIGWEDIKDRSKDSPPRPCSWVVRNPALLVETTAYLLQDRTKKVAILCFRGTEPTNVVTWLSDLAFQMERFYSWGYVHTGFYDGVRPVWPFVSNALEAALFGQEVDCSGFGRSPCGTEPTLQPPIKAGATVGLEAFFICGHSLGAALALLATALIHENPRYACLREKLRGVYTFGTPKIGDAQFADKCQAEFGNMVFRHIYGNDVITAMPPALYGPFATFGSEYVSTDDGWTHRKSRITRPCLLLSTVAVSLGGWAWNMTPILRSIKLPLSLHDHLPANYVRCSRLSLPFYG